MTRKSRSVMAWVDAEMATQPPSLDVAGRGALRGAAYAAADLVRELVDRGLGTEDREDRLEEAQVDDLAAAAVDLDVAHGDHRGHGARQSRDHVGHGQRREDRLTVLEAVARGEARHGLDQGAEPGALRVWPGLPEAGDADEDELGIALEERVGADAEALEIAEAEALDHDLEVGHEIENDPGRLRRLQVEGDALLVPGVHLPVHAHARFAPVAQRVASPGRLDLDHLGAKVGELKAQHVAGHEPGEVEDADAAQRSLAIGLEGLPGDGHRATTSEERRSPPESRPRREPAWPAPRPRRRRSARAPRRSCPGRRRQRHTPGRARGPPPYPRRPASAR